LTDGPIERQIWMVWFQGFDRSPEVVRRCVESWRQANPGWELTVVTDENLGDWVSADLLNDRRLKWLNYQHLSDLIRLDLLSRFGGVWADATCWCAVPLDSWIDSCVGPSGFFAFSRPTADRIISNWLMAATSGHLLVDRLYRDLRDYWANHRFSNDRGAIARRLLSRLLTRNDRVAQWWFSPLVANVLRVSPYHAFHYRFARLVTRDRQCRAAWESTPKITGGEVGLPLRLGLTSMANEATLAALQESTAPVFKLDWRVPIEPGSVLDVVTSGGRTYLMSKRSWAIRRSP
jgi:hypothetical protein